MSARRILILVALVALAAVPLRAFGNADPSAAGFSVSASLGGCGTAGNAITCKIDVQFGAVPGAHSYTAAATLPDGTVQDMGGVGSGEASSIYVPYVGAGTYVVTVSAWGDPAAPERKPKLLEAEDAETEDGAMSAESTSPTP